MRAISTAQMSWFSLLNTTHLTSGTDKGILIIIKITT